MIGKIAVIVILTMATAEPSFARPLWWPWQYRAPHVHHVHHRGRIRIKVAPTPDAPPDCRQINAAVKSMPPDRYERALRSATNEEQKIIADCEARP
jgi:hypothetical protein